MNGTGVRLQLPYLACVECNTQLVNHLHLKCDTAELICVFCAVKHDRGGDGVRVAPLQAESAGFCEHGEPVPDQDAAVELLISKGALVVAVGLP